MYFTKWLNKGIFFKNIYVSIIYSIIVICISMILLLVNTSIFYGTLMGIIILWIANLIIWLLWFKIPRINKTMSKITPIGVWAVRIGIFIPIFLIVVFYINPSISSETGLKLLLSPINILALIFAYSINMFSYLTIGIIDVFISINKTKKEKESK